MSCRRQILRDFASLRVDRHVMTYVERKIGRFGTMFRSPLSSRRSVNYVWKNEENGQRRVAQEGSTEPKLSLLVQVSSSIVLVVSLPLSISPSPLSYFSEPHISMGFHHDMRVHCCGAYVNIRYTGNPGSPLSQYRQYTLDQGPALEISVFDTKSGRG